MSASFRLPPEKILQRRDLFILGGAVLLSLLVFLAMSAYTYRVGFPLDDAWIHATYARSLALRGEWSFSPGVPSAGSTSPLWTVLLAAGARVGLPATDWAYFLGAGLLFGACVLFELILRELVPLYSPRFPWAGCVFALEWHFAWAAFSGMETILFILLVLAVMRMLLVSSGNNLLAGLMVGVAVWIRPDGLTLLGPLALAGLLRGGNWAARLRNLWGLAFGFSVLFLPYLILNLAISGSPMPNTFYAKQAEYAAWQSSPFINRLGLLSLQFFLGVSLAFVPGFVLKLMRAAKTRDWGILLAAAWMIGYIFLFLIRLPVYQHARYYLPALAVFILIGLTGHLEKILPSRPAALSVLFIQLPALLLLISFISGANSYARDVSFIESQMVDTARWLVDNVPADGKIAAHDIGALGYFDRHSLVDLAGLISPDIIPIMNNEQALAGYIKENGVEYLVAFQGWKPALAQGGEVIYQAGANTGGSSGLGPMVVYHFRKQ